MPYVFLPAPAATIATPNAVAQYAKTVSGLPLDHIDIHVDVSCVN